MVSTHPLIYKSSNLYTKYLVTVPSGPITTGITVTFILHSFSVLCQVPGSYLSFPFLFVSPSGQPERQSPLFGRISFLLTITWSGRLAEIRWLLSLLLLFYSLKFFHTSVSWSSYTEVWVTASLLKFPALFSKFWPISIMQLFGWSPHFVLFLSPPVPLPIFWWLYRVGQLQLT